MQQAFHWGIYSTKLNVARITMDVKDMIILQKCILEEQGEISVKCCVTLRCPYLNRFGYASCYELIALEERKLLDSLDGLTFSQWINKCISMNIINIS
jgi:hypothetical protein